MQGRPLRSSVTVRATLVAVCNIRELDTDTFETFFKANYDKAFYLAYRITHDDKTSQDIVGDSFELVWKNAREGGVANAYSYLFTIVRHLCTDFLRRKAVRDRYAQMYLFTAETAVVTDDNPHEERVRRVMAAMDGLTPRTRDIIKACFIERKQYKEVAAALGISTSAVKKHVVKGLRLLRERLKDNDS